MTEAASSRRFVWYFLGVTLTLHLQLFSIGGFPVTPAALLLPVFLARCFRSPLHPLALVVLCAALAFPALPGWLSRDTLGAVEFARTYCLWAVAVASLTLASRSPLRRPEWDVAAAGILSLTVISCFSVLQYVVARFAGSDLLYNVWGPFTYLYPYNVFERGEVRASGFYLEPSFLALVLVALVLIVSLKGNPRQQVLGPLLALPGMLVSRSFAGYIALALIVILFILSLGLARRFAAIAVGLLVLGAVGATTDTEEYVAIRATSLSEVGSSGNFRLVQPLVVLEDVLTQDPFGLPLGSVEGSLAEYDLLNGGQRGRSLDNGVYLMVYYTGWIGVGLTLSWLLFVALQGPPRWRRYCPLAIVCFTLAQFTGGVLLPEFILIFVAIVWSYRTAAMTRHGEDSEEDPVGDHSNLPRPSGIESNCANHPLPT